MNIAIWVVAAAGALAILYGIVTARSVLSADAGTQRMQEISGAVQEGARAYLNRQYRTIAIVGVIVFIILWALLGWRSGLGYLVGAVLSGAAGYIGMNVSVRANVRTAQAARQGLAAGLTMAFRAGAVTGHAGGRARPPRRVGLLLLPARDAAGQAIRGRSWRRWWR